MNITGHYIGMRRFIVILFLAFVTVSVFVSQNEGKEISFPDKLEQVMNTTSMNTYRDDFYGYAIRYPSFFEQVPDSLIKEKGCCQFYFWNVEKIVQTVFVMLNADNLTLRQGMDVFAKQLHATSRRCGSDSFVLSGPLYVDNERVDGHRFYAKYVQRQKLWFVQFLAYPESCTQAVARLINLINDWQVWEENTKQVPELPWRQSGSVSFRKSLPVPCFRWIFVAN